MHNIRMISFPVGTPEQEILEAIQKDAKKNGGGHCTDKVCFVAEPVFGDIESATSYIKLIDEGNYNGYAVKYCVYKDCDNAPRIKELKAKFDATKAAMDKFTQDHSVKNRSSAYVGCANCGSKLSRVRLPGEKCPLCCTDLRAKSTLEKIERFRKQLDKCRELLSKECHKKCRNSKTMWLVKYEYHT